MDTLYTFGDNIIPTITLKVYIFGGLMNSATKGFRAVRAVELRTYFGLFKEV